MTNANLGHFVATAEGFSGSDGTGTHVDPTSHRAAEGDFQARIRMRDFPVAGVVFEVLGEKDAGNRSPLLEDEW